MKILQAPAPFRPVDITCKNCCASLQAESLEDFRRTVGSDMRGESWDYLTVRCPCCRASVTVEVNRVPAHLLNQIKRTE